MITLLPLSEDNGKHWSEPEIRWTRTVVPEGKVRYGEPSALWDSDKELLVVLANKVLYPNDQLNFDAQNALVMDIYDGRRRVWLDRRELVIYMVRFCERGASEIWKSDYYRYRIEMSL